MRERSSEGHEGSLKLLLERVERERDMALADLRRAQEERDRLRDRIKVRLYSTLRLCESLDKYRSLRRVVSLPFFKYLQ